MGHKNAVQLLLLPLLDNTDALCYCIVITFIGQHRCIVLLYCCYLYWTTQLYGDQTPVVSHVEDESRLRHGSPHQNKPPDSEVVAHRGHVPAKGAGNQVTNYSTLINGNTFHTLYLIHTP